LIFGLHPHETPPDPDKEVAVGDILERAMHFVSLRSIGLPADVPFKAARKIAASSPLSTSQTNKTEQSSSQSVTGREARATS
jgi:hypothetical protein